MTITASTPVSGPYLANGTQTTFARDFLITDATQLLVYALSGDELTQITTGFSVTNVGATSGNVVFTTAPAAGLSIILARATPNVQQSDYDSQGQVTPGQAESDFDLVVMQIQELVEKSARALTVHPGETAPRWDAETVNSYLMLDADGNVTTGEDISASISAMEIAASVIAAELDGRDFRAPTRTVLTSGTAQTYTPPTGCQALSVRLVGGGGGGGPGTGAGSGSTAVGGSGGGGGYVEALIEVGATDYTYSVGAAGAGGSGGPNDGSAGTASTFVANDGPAVTLSAGGGGGGINAGPVVDGYGGERGAGGTASGGDVNVPGSSPMRVYIAGGFAMTMPMGGVSHLSASQHSGVNTDAASSSSLGYGAGGPGAVSSNIAMGYAGGDGSSGIIIITEFY